MDASKRLDRIEQAEPALRKRRISEALEAGEELNEDELREYLRGLTDEELALSIALDLGLEAESGGPFVLALTGDDLRLLADGRIEEMSEPARRRYLEIKDHMESDQAN